MHLNSLLHKLVGLLKVAPEKLGQVLGFVENNAGDIEKYAEMALPIIQAIDKLVPNRTLDELTALAQKFALHLTPEIAASPIEVETLLQNSALKELQAVAPGIPNSLLRSAISLSVNAVRAKTKADIVIPPATATTANPA